MSDFMTIDRTRMNGAAPAGSGTPPAATPEAADTALFDALLESPGDRDVLPRDGRAPTRNGADDGDASCPTAREGNPAGTSATATRTRQGEPAPEEHAREGRPGHADGGREAERQDAAATPFAGMANPFAAFLDGRTQAAAAPVAARPATDVAELTERLVDRILVSSPGEATREVRISLADGTLSSTEIGLVRHSDGTLTVTLRTDDAASFQTLVQTRADLQERLERLGEHARVDVEGHAADDGDPDRRSKGYTGWQTDEA